MRQLNLSPRLLLIVACAIAGAACSSSEGLVQPASTPIVGGSTTGRGGIEGLRQDIAWARSLPFDVKLGTSGGAISRDQLVASLEASLRGWTSASTSPRFGISPSSGRLDLSPGDVGGAGTMYYSYTDAQGYRWVNLYAYTECTQGSMVVAKIELNAAWYNFLTGDPIGPWPIWNASNSAPNYVSRYASAGLGGTLMARAQAHNKHTCEYGDTSNYPFKYSDPWTVV